MPLALVAALALNSVLTDARAGGVVTNCTEAALRTALAGGGMVTVQCSGTIALTNTLVITNTTTLTATGSNLTLNGSNAVRLIEIKPGVSLTLSNVVLTLGRDTNGGAIFNNGGTLHAVRCGFVENTALGLSTQGRNQLGSPGNGGGVWNGGSADFVECRFLGNRAVAGVGPAAYADPITRAVPKGAFDGNGGAIFNRGGMVIASCLFTTNQAIGGQAECWYDMNEQSMVALAAGGLGQGGAIYNEGTIDVGGSTFDRNASQGGRGALLYPYPNNPVPPFRTLGCDGGNGMGGGILSSSGVLTLTNCTLYGNLAMGGPPLVGSDRSGTNGIGLGGGISLVSNIVNAAFCTLASNTATKGGALFAATGSTFRLGRSIVAASPTGGNALGPVQDLGFNLASDATLALTNVGSVNNIDPLLGPLANNGGPTLTMALLPGSPAINAVSNAPYPVTDQRGVVRPYSTACDIGALEYLPPFRIGFIRPDGPGFKRLGGSGALQRDFIVQSSPDLIHWSEIAIGTTDGSGNFEMRAVNGSSNAFFRILAP